MAYPGISIKVENGNLQQQIAVADAVPALAATVNTAELVGKMQTVYTLADAESKGYTEEAEPFMHGLLEEYYTELGGSQLLYVYGTGEGMTMTEALTATEKDGIARLLKEAGGEINLVAVARKPGEEYDPGTAFLDKDVATAVTVSKTLCEAQQAANTPVRILIEGRVANADIANDYSPNEAGNGFAGVVLGGSSTDGSAAVALVLARAAKYAAHVKIGSGENGALTATQIYIGGQRMEERSDMETLHDAGFITFMHRPGAAGYYFGRDNMCENGDFRILAHGRIMDKAQRVAAQAYLPFVETSIRMESDGTINASDAVYISNVLDSAIRSAMGSQISNVEVGVPLTQDIINTSTLQVQVKIQPLGYLTWITVTMGLASQL